VMRSCPRCYSANTGGQAASGTQAAPVKRSR
jgi:hypothetical protein